MDKKRHLEVSSQGGKKRIEDNSKEDSLDKLTVYRREPVRMEDVLNILDGEQNGL